MPQPCHHSPSLAVPKPARTNYALLRVPPYWLQALLVFKVTESRPKFCTRLERLYVRTMGARAAPDLQNNTFMPASSEFPFARSTIKSRCCLAALA
jgi:hypothetical protein